MNDKGKPPVSRLRQLFGPSREEIWRRLTAEQLRDSAGRYIDGGFWRADKVEARHGQWTITLDTYSESTGESSMTYTRMRAPFVNPSEFRFTIYRRGLFSDIATWFGMQHVKIGHQPFDSEFIIQGTSEARLAQLFANPRIRALITAQPKIRLTVKDDEGWFGATFPKNVDELCFTCAGVIKDAERLGSLFELFSETLDQLCRIGSAYVDDPRVAL